jgi:predicted dehydrogenase
MRYKKNLLLGLTICLSVMVSAQEKLQVVIAGLSHDHVNRILEKNKAGEIVIIAIAEKNKELSTKKQTEYSLPDSIFFNTLSVALQKKKPDIVMAFNATSEHLAVIETCMPLRIPVTVEKPLSFSVAEVKKMEELSKKFNTKIYTNFPSIWYTGFMELLKRKNEINNINKMVMRGGHRGPKDVVCSKEFVGWLTDSAKNGGGAITDFGCYGASIMTALMNGKKPISVYAVTRTINKAKYPNVDDDATITLEYKNCTGIIDASWNLPYTIMEVEAFASNSYYHASEYNAAGAGAFFEIKNDKEIKRQEITVNKYKDEIDYLTDVIKNKAEETNELMSLEYNIIIVSILDAARKSARTGKKTIL